MVHTKKNKVASIQTGVCALHRVQGRTQLWLQQQVEQKYISLICFFNMYPPPPSTAIDFSCCAFTRSLFFITLTCTERRDVSVFCSSSSDRRCKKLLKRPGAWWTHVCGKSWGKKNKKQNVSKQQEMQHMQHLLFKCWTLDSPLSGWFVRSLKWKKERLTYSPHAMQNDSIWCRSQIPRDDPLWPRGRLNF